MADDNDDDWGDAPAALVSYGNPPMNVYQQVTTKIPPTYNGTTSWFAYEEAIDDWVDITELEAEKRGPALRNRLEGEAAVYRALLDRDRLRDPNNGVRYFKQSSRPHLVKSNESVFLWRFIQLSKAHRDLRTCSDWLDDYQSYGRESVKHGWIYSVQLT